jgi:uncharacterized protein
MAAFECNRCGKCCVSLGPHVLIERQLNDREYYCRSAIDNEMFPAIVDPMYREEISDEYETRGSYGHETNKKSCGFLRKNREGEGTVCAIYATRPKVCRDFRCYRMIIRTREREICGRVIGKYTLITGDAVLERLWNAQVVAISPADPVAWEKNVAGILAEHGYCADFVE